LALIHGPPISAITYGLTRLASQAAASVSSPVGGR
jgi:hypothetical protein